MARRPRDPSRYSRWVGFLKIALPLVAVGVLSTVFLVQREDTFESGLVFTKIDMATLGDGLTISNPRFSGLTRTGDTFTLTASRALPDSSRAVRVEMADINAEVQYMTGFSVTAAAAHGLAIIPDQTLALSGQLTAEGSNGYRFAGRGGTFDLRAGTFVSDGAVRIEGPGQVVTAGSLRVTADAEGRTRLFLFENGVKVTYDPDAGGN